MATGGEAVARINNDGQRVIYDARGRRNLLTEQGPSPRQQSTSWVRWGDLEQVLGQPFSQRRVTMTQLNEMRYDPMIAFGLSFIKVPVIRAPWYIRGSDAQVNAFVDGALRAIYGDYMLGRLNALDMGYAPAEKRFGLEQPDWTWVDPDTKDDQGNPTTRKVWDAGNTMATTWKPFTWIQPERCHIRWTEGTGEFNGFTWGPRSMPFVSPAPSNEQIVDVDHALWTVNAKAQEFGSPYGYPRIAHCMPYWWAYWFRWAMANRAFERHADPALMVFYPAGRVRDDNGSDVNVQAQAEMLGTLLRSGSTVTIPNLRVMGADMKPGDREWEIKPLEIDTGFEAFQRSFEYLDVMKIRCVAGDTLVDCPRDHATHPAGVPIRDIQPGQVVWTFNEGNRLYELNRVLRSMCTMRNQPTYRVLLSDGRSVTATDTHPFLTVDLRWKSLSDLCVGDRLLAFESDIDRYVKIDPARGMRFAFEAKEYRHVARFLWEDIEGSEIHHKDGRHADSSEANLEVMDPSEHRSLTMRGNRQSESTREQISRRKNASKNEARALRVAALRAEDDALLAERQLDLVDGKKPGLRGIYACPDCGRDYASTGSRQKRCRACSVLYNVEWQRQYDWHGRARRTEPPSWAEKASFVEVVEIEEGPMQDVWDLAIDTDDDGCRNFVAAGVVLHNSLWIPEQGLVEGSGGTSSRNVAAEMSDTLYEGQAVMKDAEIDTELNRFVIPQLIAINFPERRGVKAEIVTRGFAAADVAMRRNLINIIGGAEPDRLPANMREILEEFRVPLESPEVVAARQKAAMEAQQKFQQQDQQGKGVSGDGGAVDIRNPAGFGGSKVTTIRRANLGELGAVPLPIEHADGAYADVDVHGRYIQQRRTLELAEPVPLLAMRKQAGFTRDEAALGYAGRIYDAFRDALEEAYVAVAEEVAALDSLDLAEGDDLIDEAKRLAATSRAASIVQSAAAKLDGIFDRALTRAGDAFRRLMGHAGRKELKRAGYDPAIWEADNEEARAWMASRGATLVRNVSETTREEMRDFIAKQMNVAQDPKGIAKAISEHFGVFPAWRAQRIARTEARDAYNASTLLAGLKAGASYAQASDASGGRNLKTDQDCIDRNGKVFPITAAMLEDDHPNGTLGWRILPRGVTIGANGEVQVGFAEGDSTVLLEPATLEGFDARPPPEPGEQRPMGELVAELAQRAHRDAILETRAGRPAAEVADLLAAKAPTLFRDAVAEHLEPEAAALEGYAARYSGSEHHPRLGSLAAGAAVVDKAGAAFRVVRIDGDDAYLATADGGLVVTEKTTRVKRVES